MIHWAQTLRLGLPSRFDYGEGHNRRYYNRSTPPRFRLRVPRTIPVVVFTGDRDILATPEDYVYFKKHFRGTLLYEEVIRGYAHLDFVWALDARTRVYEKILRFMPEPY